MTKRLVIIFFLIQVFTFIIYVLAIAIAFYPSVEPNPKYPTPSWWHWAAIFQWLLTTSILSVPIFLNLIKVIRKRAVIRGATFLLIPFVVVFIGIRFLEQNERQQHIANLYEILSAYFAFLMSLAICYTYFEKWLDKRNIGKVV